MILRSLLTPLTLLLIATSPALGSDPDAREPQKEKQNVTSPDRQAASEAKSAIHGAHLRVARPTNDLEALIEFYRDGLGFEIIGSFEDHEGWDGVMLGHPGAPYHLEFIVHRGHTAPRAPTRDNLLVFYLPERERWEAAVARLKRHGFEPVASENPYWDRRGKTFEDPDGYRIVLQQAPWG